MRQDLGSETDHNVIDQLIDASIRTTIFRETCSMMLLHNDFDVIFIRPSGPNTGRPWPRGPVVEQEGWSVVEQEGNTMAAEATMAVRW